jgi:hypothetical protein
MRESAGGAHLGSEGAMSGDFVRRPYAKPFVRSLDASGTESGKTNFSPVEFTGPSEFGSIRHSAS